jgi:hypothetical protein
MPPSGGLSVSHLVQNLNLWVEKIEPISIDGIIFLRGNPVLGYSSHGREGISSVVAQKWQSFQQWFQRLSSCQTPLLLLQGCHFWSGYQSYKILNK